jgi:hypothetical protein
MEKGVFGSAFPALSSTEVVYFLINRQASIVDGVQVQPAPFWTKQALYWYVDVLNCRCAAGLVLVRYDGRSMYCCLPSVY